MPPTDLTDKFPTALRIDRSPMNPKVRIVALSCGHDLYLSPGKRSPKIGTASDCEKCRNKAKESSRD